MEDIKQYIESGILELYVLDDLNQQEKLEVERMAANYPAVQKELDDISESLSLYAEQNAIEPSERLRESILNQLEFNTDKNSFVSQSNHLEDKKVVQLQPAYQTNYFKYAFAASIALLLVSLVALFNTYNQLKESRQQLVSLQSQNQKFANQVNFQENQLNEYKQQLGQTTIQQKPAFTDTVVVNSGDSRKLIAMQATELKESRKKLLALESVNKNREKVLNIFSDPNSRFIKLKGMPYSPSSQMLIAWNPDKKQLYINKIGSTLPVNDKEHQYQLWAITKLKPVSLGVFDVRKKDSVIQSMISVDKAAAFAVTLEPRGGSEKPTLKQMMVMGLSHK